MLEETLDIVSFTRWCSVSSVALQLQQLGTVSGLIACEEIVYVMASQQRAQGLELGHYTRRICLQRLALQGLVEVVYTQHGVRVLHGMDGDGVVEFLHCPEIVVAQDLQIIVRKKSVWILVKVKTVS